MKYLLPAVGCVLVSVGAKVADCFLYKTAQIKVASRSESSEVVDLMVRALWLDVVFYVALAMAVVFAALWLLARWRTCRIQHGTAV